jgi:hypothetical protein
LLADRTGTLNDAALAALFCTLRDWDALHGAPVDRGTYRIVVPGDLRVRGDERMPAANRLTFIFLTMPVRQCTQPHLLRPLLGARTQEIWRTRQDLDFLRSIEGLDRFDRLPALSRSGRVFASACLSNISLYTKRYLRPFPVEGEFHLIGDLKLAGYVSAAPLRAGMRATVCLQMRWNRLEVLLRFDPWLYDDDEGRILLDLFLRRLREAVA